LQIQAQAYHEKPNIRYVISNPEKIAGIVEKIPQIAAFTDRGQNFSLISSENRTCGALVTGIDPERESRVSRLKSLVRQGTFLAEDDTNQALVGRLLARNLRVGIGDELTILGQGRDGSIAATVVEIKGIFNSGIDDFDRASIQIPLKTFQEVYDMNGAIHELVIIANSLSDVDPIKKTLQAELSTLNTGNDLAILDWNELMPGLRQSIEMDLISGLIFYLLLVVVVAFSISNTFLMAIFERTREFGMLMAIGTSPGRLTKVLLIESMSMTGIGIAGGIIIGCLLTLYFQVHGVDISGASELLSQFGITGRIYPRLSWISAISGPLAVLIITFLAALYPALKVQRMKPVEAMRAV
jgi:ABC-type lipoprotein release transport system permease subunit